MSVINSSGGMFTLNAPFPDSLNFSFDQLASDGQDHFIQVVISEASNCVNTFSYTAPLACNACSVSASLLDTVNCTGLPIQLQATDVPGANYNWTGPNGFTSSEQNPILHDAELAMTGVYQLDVYNPIDSCHSIALVNVIVHQFPDDVSITGNVPVCAGDSLILDVPHYSDAIYTWTKSGIYYSSDTTLYFQPVTGFNHGTYSCSINIGGCINNSGIENVIVNPVPSTPILSFNALFNSLYALQTQGNYQWNFGFVPLIGQTIDTLQLVQPGYYSVTVSNDFGCDVSSELFFYDPTGIPELPFSRLTLQPNPARDNMQVSVPEIGILEVRDLAGKCVKENNLQLGVNSISVNELAAGIYFFQFRSNTGVRVAKVIVEHN
jgi:hypothetical protein